MENLKVEIVPAGTLKRFDRILIKFDPEHTAVRQVQDIIKQPDGRIRLCLDLGVEIICNTGKDQFKVITADLFEQPELLPAEVRQVLESYDCDADPYHECDRVNKALEPLGYSFSWGLDGQPYDLHLINQ